jgi:hypothetical protein
MLIIALTTNNTDFQTEINETQLCVDNAPSLARNPFLYAVTTIKYSD